MARASRTSGFAAALLCFRTGLRLSGQERAMARALHGIFARLDDPAAILGTVPETQPYRDRAAIGRLLADLSMAVKDWREFPSCFLVRV